MPSPILLSGVVRSVGQTPVENATILVESSPAPVQDVALLSGPGGRFTLSLPGPGAYRILCRANGFETLHRTVELFEQEPEDLVLELHRIRGPRI